MRLGLFFFSTLLLPIFGKACLWDSDTLAMEAQGRIEVLETVLGWYDRFPPLYYEKRLERVTREVAQTPDKLELYDDAGVACDKLGKVDEAIEWMKKKEAAMASLPADKAKEHRYRYLANLGTFHAHRWVKTPDREQTPADIDLAIRLITEAIKINPDAHFGREKTQLVLLQWLREPQKGPLSKFDSDSLMRQALGCFSDLLKAHPELDAVKGLCGIIQIGAGQDSVDLHLLLAHQLGRSDFGAGTLSYVVDLRIAEMLLHESRKPFIAGFANLQGQFQPLTKRETGEDQITKLADALMERRWSAMTSTHDSAPVTRWFFESRAAAIQRRSDKDAFMMARLSEGQHPDTHPDFWAGWKEPAFPAQTFVERLVGTKLAAVVDQSINHTAKFVYLFLVLVALYLGLRALSLLIKRRSSKPPQM